MEWKLHKWITMMFFYSMHSFRFFSSFNKLHNEFSWFQNHLFAIAFGWFRVGLSWCFGLVFIVSYATASFHFVRWILFFRAFWLIGVLVIPVTTCLHLNGKNSILFSRIINNWRQITSARFGIRIFGHFVRPRSDY